MTEAQAPFGSLYHLFPGGKEQLGAEAIRTSGALYELLIPAVFDPAPDLVTGRADVLRRRRRSTSSETDYADACPIATVALEVSSSSETMRVACADVFESWIDEGTELHAEAGLDPDTARELTIAMIAALEGAFVLARALRDTEPLDIAGETIAARVQAAISEA